MKLRNQARETLDNVTDASKTVIQTTEWATIALIAVTVISVLALSVGILALGKINDES